MNNNNKGLILIGIGVLFLTQQIGLIDLSYAFSMYWPMILILIGLMKFNKNKDDITAIAMLLIGGYFQLDKFDLVDFINFDLFWPGMLVIIGAYLILKPNTN